MHARIGRALSRLADLIQPAGIRHNFLAQQGASEALVRDLTSWLGRHLQTALPRVHSKGMQPNLHTPFTPAHLAGKCGQRDKACRAQVGKGRLDERRRGLGAAQRNVQSAQHSVHSAGLHQLLRCAATVPAHSDGAGLKSGWLDCDNANALAPCNTLHPPGQGADQGGAERCLLLLGDVRAAAPQHGNKAGWRPRLAHQRCPCGRGVQGRGRRQQQRFFSQVVAGRALRRRG